MSPPPSDCVAAGGDADAFVAARRPADPPSRETQESAAHLTALARSTGSPGEELEPSRIEVRDLDPGRKANWSTDQWARAFGSGFVAWLKRVETEPGWAAGPGSPLRFMAERDAERGAAQGFDRPPGARRREDATIDVADLDPQELCDWSYDQLIRAWRSGLLRGLPAQFWDDLAAQDSFGADASASE